VQLKAEEQDGDNKRETKEKERQGNINLHSRIQLDLQEWKK
jgi:hypothetical protein